MPLFEYQCKTCGKVFDVFTQRREPTARPKCPACGKANAERILSAFSATRGDGGGCATSSFGFG